MLCYEGEDELLQNCSVDVDKNQTRRPTLKDIHLVKHFQRGEAF